MDLNGEDQKDAGVIVPYSNSASFSDSSTITDEDLEMHQMIFDRLPLNENQRKDLYSWLCSEKSSKSDEVVQETNKKKRKR